MASANAVLLRSFAVFAVSKSLYYRWIAKGHEIQFPKDTRIRIQLNQR
jgi:predicted DNA-binding transcriptional regulator AlpA